MKSELLIKMTASVALLSASTIGLGSMSEGQRTSDSAPRIIAYDASKSVGGLEYELDNAIENMDYTSLVQQISTNGRVVDMTSKSVTTNDNTSKKYKKMFLANTKSCIFVREHASKNSEIVGKMYSNDVGKIISYVGDFVKIESGDVYGFVKKTDIVKGLSDSDFLLRATKRIATVNADLLRVREKQNKDSNVVGLLKKGETCTVNNEYKEWYEIYKEGKKVGYISKEYVDVTKKFEVATPVEEKKTDKTSKMDTSKDLNVKSTKKTQSKNSNKVTVSYDSPVGNLTQEEYKYLACIVFCEAGIEPYNGKVGVVNVIMNRVKSGNFPNSVIGVITQRGQFSPYRTGKLARELAKYESGKYSSDGYRKECVRAVNDALKGMNTVGKRAFFNGVAAESGKGHPNPLVIGGHMFW